jgi:hypothetical protein
VLADLAEEPQGLPAIRDDVEALFLLARVKALHHEGVSGVVFDEQHIGNAALRVVNVWTQDMVYRSFSGHA